MCRRKHFLGISHSWRRGQPCLLAFAVDYRNPLRDVDAGGSYDVLTDYTNNGTQGNDWAGCADKWLDTLKAGG